MLPDRATSYPNEEQNPQNNNPQHPLSNQMIEQINIALEQKGSGNFSAWVIEACRRRLTSEKAYTSIKSDEEWAVPRSSLRTELCCKFHLITRHCNGELQFYHFPDSDRLRVGLCHRLNSLND